MSTRCFNARPTRGAAASSPATGLLPFASMTCEPSAPTTPRAATSSAAVAPARTCRSQGSALASKVSAAVCGPNKRASFASFGPSSRCGRTSPVLALPFASEASPSHSPQSQPFSETFPRSGMMRSGSLFELPTLERLTSESASSSSRGEWTTPKASDVERGDCPSERARRTPFLPSQVRSTWNTPTVEDAGRNGSLEWARRWAAGETIPETQQRLRTQALWPTATAGNSGGNRSAYEGAPFRPSLAGQARQASPQGSAWPTPAARDYKDTGTSPAEFDRNTPGLAACAGGSLNPSWVGRLMGFPDGWTSPLTDGPSAPAKRSPKASRRASRRSGGNDGRD